MIDEALIDPRVCILIASKDGSAVVGGTIDRCVRQADVYAVSDGSGDDTAAVARRHGAAVLDLTENVGKPAAIRAAYEHFELALHYDAILILDDDTRLAPDFVERSLEHLGPGVAVVCGETRSDWLHESRWNGIVGSRALAYWRYGLFLKQGQHVLDAITVIPGSNSVFRTEVMTELLSREVRYIVDDTQWLLDIQTERMGRVVYARDAKAFVQDPTTPASWYRQTLRWTHGTFQGIRGHRIGLRRSWFSVAYTALILDWVLYVVVWPVVLAVVAWRAAEHGHLATAAAIYFGGYVLWAMIGAIALKAWRLPLLTPWLVVMDWAQRAVFVHSFVKVLREPTSECKWSSPARIDTRDPADPDRTPAMVVAAARRSTDEIVTETMPVADHPPRRSVAEVSWPAPSPARRIDSSPSPWPAPNGRGHAVPPVSSWPSRPTARRCRTHETAKGGASS